jgi:hypothetical protein
MKQEKLSKANSCCEITMDLLAARANSKNKGFLAGVNYKTGGVMFFPFAWFAFWWRQKICKAKQSLTKAERDKGKENVIEKADISQEL